MKEQGYHAGYKYAHDYPDGYVPQEYLPRELQGHSFYDPTVRGYEATVKNRLDARRHIQKRDGRKEKE